MSQWHKTIQHRHVTLGWCYFNIDRISLAFGWQVDLITLLWSGIDWFKAVITRTCLFPDLFILEFEDSNLNPGFVYQNSFLMCQVVIVPIKPVKTARTPPATVVLQMPLTHAYFLVRLHMCAYACMCASKPLTACPPLPLSTPAHPPPELTMFSMSYSVHILRPAVKPSTDKIIEYSELNNWLIFYLRRPHKNAKRNLSSVIFSGLEYSFYQTQL